MAGKVFRSHVQISRLQARQIVDTAFSEARNTDMEPLTVVVLDMGGNIIAAEREDGCARCALPWPGARPMPHSAMALPVVSWENAISNDRPFWLRWLQPRRGHSFPYPVGS